jgi:hypothetical protein
MLVLFYLVTVITILSGYLLGDHDTWFMEISVNSCLAKASVGQLLIL